MTKLTRMTTLSFLISFLISLFGCAVLPSSSSSPLLSTTPSLSATDLASLAERFDALRTTSQIPGMSLAVVADGKIVLARGFGFADIGQDKVATENTAYNIASVAKPISAVVAMRLVELNQLNLDRPMTSFGGFADFCANARASGGIFWRDVDCTTPALTLKRVLSMTSNGVPGQRFFYNPPLYSWASRPMAEVSGAPFSALVAQHVFAPAGMNDSARIHRTLPLPPALAATLATPYRHDAAGKIVVSAQPLPQGDGAAGGVISTAVDLARFDIALDSGKLITDASRTAMWASSRTNDGIALPYAIGWFTRNVRGENLLWHTGLWDDAYSALYLKIPQRKVSLILLANSDRLKFSTPLDAALIENSPFAMAFLDVLMNVVKR